MCTFSPRRSVAAFAVVAGLLAVGAPADARIEPTTNGGATAADAVTVLDQDLNSVRADTSVGHGKLPSATPRGLIMKDGNICDPIRHIGC